MLDFKGKEFVFNHHLSVPYRPIVPHPEKSTGDPSADGNLVIHGDNLHALKALLPRYAGKVDCIYIDPPYNTGKENWYYNDNVNSPYIVEWLSSNPVGIEDGLRHDKWLALIYPRLKLLRELLTEEGVIFVSIDDNELYHLRLAMDEIFGVNNWLGTIVWKNVTDNNPTNISIEHEYIVCFAKTKSLIPVEWKSQLSDIKAMLVEAGDTLVSRYKNPDRRSAAYQTWFRENKPFLGPLDRYKYIDEGGIYTGSQSVHNPGREGYRYDVLHPKTGKPCKQPLMGYRFPEETMKNLLAEGKIIFGDDENKIIELKVYAKEFQDKLPSVIELDGRLGAYELREIFPEQKKVFDNPKPSQLLIQLLGFVMKPGSLVLDSFAGSGTTGHAILALNRKDGGNRRFILVECEDYAENLTAERIKRVITGVPDANDESIRAGLGGNLVYCTLGEPLDLEKLLTGERLPDYKTLGAWLFHTATGQPLDQAHLRESESYLGEVQGRRLWLYYRPDLEWLKSPSAALTFELAQKLARSDESKSNLVFAPAKFVSNKDLTSLRVEYAPLPFSLYRVQTSGV